MSYIDGHCDVISKLLDNPKSSFYDDQVLTATLPRMEEGGALLQFFAIYIPDKYRPASFEHVLRSIDLFYERVLSERQIKFVRTTSDLKSIGQGQGIGALLALEGVDAVPNDPLYIRILYQLGVRSIGMTWNHANWAADGAMEPRKGGLTRAGKQLVKECEKLGILLDVSHLSERAFWDVAHLSNRPLFASHSNVFDLCPHPRNLSQKQIDHLIERKGMIGLSFVPYFVQKKGSPSTLDLLLHLDYICSRGGMDCVGFGSDFDGVEVPLKGIEHPGKYAVFRETLSKYYSDSIVDAFLYGNWFNYLMKNLPGDVY